MTHGSVQMAVQPARITGAGLHHAIGIDVGGTKIAGGIVDLLTGRITARQQVATGCDEGGAAVLARVSRVAQDLMAQSDDLPLAGLGVGVAELVDKQGAVFSGHRIAWQGMPVAAQLSAILPARVESDVRTAALAEARLGAGTGHSDFLYVTIGTGISAVSVRAGVPYAGSRGAALVLANGLTRPHCAQCGARTDYVLEDVASGPGLVAGYVAKGGAARQAEDVLAAALAGDARAVAVIDLAALRLGNALALLAGALDPGAVILGGGLGSAPGPYFEAITREMRAGLWADDPRPLPVLNAALGADAGIIGAALAAAAHFQQEPDNRPFDTRTDHHGSE